MATQKPEPRILTFTKPDNIRGSVHGKISAYHELWGLVENQRYRVFIAGTDLQLKHGLAYNNAVNTQLYIKDRLKELGCINLNTCEKWIDND